MRCAAVNAFEQPDEMKFGKAGFVGNVIQVDAFAEMRIHKKLCLDNALAEINFGIGFFHKKRL
jgi:hypothetical protein